MGFFRLHTLLCPNTNQMTIAPQPTTPPPVLFPPGRSNGLRRLRSFLDSIDAYAARRNYALPGHREVSRLSPYLRHRLLSEAELIAEVLQQYNYEDAAKFIDEVAWRTYWKGFLELHPSIWRRYREDCQSLPQSLNRDTEERYRAAVNGQTGIECFDHWVHQLTGSGYLHNHVRMWFASIWIFTLRLPWQLGADFFLRHLLDGDPASNTLSWRWVAGLHSQGKHYLARADNIRRFTEGHFDPAGQLREEADPLPPDGPHPRSGLAPVASGADLSVPSLSACPAGLLVLPEDLSPETSQLREAPFSSICVLHATDVLRPIQPADRQNDFLNQSLDDTVQRVAAHWNADIHACQHHIEARPRRTCAENVGCRHSGLPLYDARVQDFVSAVTTWARNENLNSIWLLQPPIGPYRDAMPALRTAMATLNVRLHEYRRRWDDLHWPQATAGYFRFRKSLHQRIQRFLTSD